MTKLKVACVQTSSRPDPQENIDIVLPLIREAHAQGAQLITTPEIVGMLEPKRALSLQKAKPEETHEVLAAFRGIAAELSVWLLAGSLSIKLSEDKLVNRSFMINDRGEIVARYDKIHMFDVQVGDGHQYRESHTYQPGEEPVLVDTPWGRFGMTICYDIRFAYLYRKLAHAGAKMIFAPAAFTKVTGEAHWHVLQRARAIETGTFIVSAAQTGTHEGGRQTYGHSVIVDPWGKILSDGGEEVGISMAEVDLAEVEAARGKVPSLTHDRELGEPVVYGEALREAGE